MGGDDPRACLTMAVGLLARRDHSIKALKSKLRSRAFDEAVIDDTLERLQREGLVCDERFVEAYVRSRAARGFGPLRLRQELLEHDMDEALITRHLAQLDWQMLAVNAWRKRFKGMVPDNAGERAKQIRFLQYRGFDMEQIRRLMNHDEWDD